MRGNFSTNYQLAGRELLTPDEVRMLDNRYAIVLIRGERPVMDGKYDIFKHPNIALSAIGGGEVYRHGKERLAACGITIVNLADYPGKQMKDFPLMESMVEDIEAYDQDELEIYINLKEQQENEKKK